MTSTTRPARESGNIRNGTRSKTVLTEPPGRCEIEVPRDRAGTFEPQIVAKRQRRLSGVDEIVLSLYAKGLTTGEIQAHFAEIYGASVSKETISRITDKVIEEMTDWSEPATGRGLRGDLHRRDRGQGPRRAGRQPADLRRDRGHPGRGTDILGLWAGTGGEGAKFWMSVLTDLRNRGVQGRVLRRLRRAQGPARGGRQRVAADDRADLHHPSDPQHVPAGLPQDWDALKRDLKPIYTAVNAAAARAAFDELAEKWGSRYPAIIRLWDNAWEEFIPFLDYDVEIRRVICSHERDRVAERPLPAGGQGPRALPDRAGRAEVPVPGHPIPGPDRAGRTRWTMRWKPALNAFAITFGDRFPAAETY